MEKNPRLAYAWNNLGRYLNEKKTWAGALEALNQSLVLEPNQVEPLLNRGKAYFERQRY